MNLREGCSGYLGISPEVDKNHDGHDDDEEDYNSKNDTDDHDSTWTYDMIRQYE